MSEATDFLRKLGMPDAIITKMQADLDQSMAEADHLIDHAVRLHRSSVAAAALEGAAIRIHIVDHDEDQLRRLLAALISRSGQLADTVERLSIENTPLQTALAAERGAQA